MEINGCRCVMEVEINLKFTPLVSKQQTIYFKTCNFLALSSDNVFQVSFVLSNTTWNDTYSNSSHPDYVALKNAILTEVGKIIILSGSMAVLVFEVVK